jgi:Tol biopolymer transport system component
LAAALAGPAGGQMLSAGFGKNKIQYRQFDWKIYHSPHFDVYYYAEGEPLLEKVVSMAESAYDRLAREFDHQIQDPVPLIFYVTHSQFEQNNIIPNFIPEGIGAFASPVRNRMVMPVDLPDGELFELVMHELTHIFQYDAIFQGKFGRGVAGTPPQWFMEGMASYMAKDEGTIEKMFLRDAVVNDRVPSILERGVSGYMAYRFGHAAFDYIEERWGKEGFRDFVYEFRNTLGGRPERAMERALRIEPEEFDLDFRRWLRKQYLPELVEKGEPSDFGRPFRDEKGEIDEAISPAGSPSGDLLAALVVTKGDLDVVLYDGKNRRPLANLTKGFAKEYQNLIAQHLTTKARMGRDLAFSPDGNTLAAFAKRERGRVLALVDVLRRRLERTIDMEVEQQHAPAFSPDGKKLAFAGNRGGAFDVFVLDLGSGAVTNLTADAAYDGAPAFSPDGEWLVYASAVGGEHTQLFRIALADPARRERLTTGEWNDKDAVFGSDGKWLYFTSDRSGSDNVWGIELATGKTVQFTNAVTGCFMPTVLRGAEGRDRLVYTGLWRGSFDLYLLDLEQPVTEPTTTALAPQPVAVEALPSFEPDIQVAIDPANREPYQRSKLFLEDGGGTIGITDDQYLLGGGYLSFSDYLGDRRLIATFSSVDTFSNFDIFYLNMTRRWNWAIELFDSRDFFVAVDPTTGRVVDQQAVLTVTGLVASWVYPFDFAHRLELGAGFIAREYDFQQIVRDESGDIVYRIEPRSDEYPLAQASFVGDSAVGDMSGPVSGRRYRLRASYGYDTDQGGSLSTNVDLDFRQYVRISERTGLALRAFGGWADGSFPSVYFIGGLDTLRGIDFRSQVGDRAFFVNLEFRFPLLDALVGPVFDFRGIRGRVFLDVGGAWLDYAGEEFDFWNSDESRLEDAISAYGWGFTVRFAGFDLNWDFAQRWDFKDRDEEGFRTSFWIGSRF